MVSRSERCLMISFGMPSGPHFFYVNGLFMGFMLTSVISYFYFVVFFPLPFCIFRMRLYRSCCWSFSRIYIFARVFDIICGSVMVLSSIRSSIIFLPRVSTHNPLPHSDYVRSYLQSV